MRSSPGFRAVLVERRARASHRRYSDRQGRRSARQLEVGGDVGGCGSKWPPPCRSDHESRFSGLTKPSILFVGVKKTQMLFGRKILAACFGGLALATSGTVTHAQQVNIVIKWVEVQHEVRPRAGSVWRVDKVVRLTLRGGNKVSEAFTATSGGRSVASESSGQFRALLKDNASWRVEDSRTLVRTWNKSQHTETIRVIVGPGRNCIAKISYHLKSGFGEYRMPSIHLGVPLYFSSVAAEQVSCVAIPG